MSQIDRIIVAETWEQARSQIQDLVVRLATILNNGLRWSSQFRQVIPVELDTTQYPVSIRGATGRLAFVPRSVLLLSAVPVRGGSDVVQSGGAVNWRFRGDGVLLIDSVPALPAGRYTATFLLTD